MMTVLLQSEPNPDLNQYGAIAPTFRLPVASFEDAVAACREYIARYNLGGGNWTGGEVMVDGVLVARISYNGWVWPVSGGPIE